MMAFGANSEHIFPLQYFPKQCYVHMFILLGYLYLLCISL